MDHIFWLIDQLPIPVVVHNKNKIIHANDAFRVLLSVSCDGEQSDFIAWLTHIVTVKKNRDELQKAIEDKREIAINIEGQIKGAVRYWLIKSIILSSDISRENYQLTSLADLSSSHFTKSYWDLHLRVSKATMQLIKEMAERKKLEEKTTQLSNQLIIAARHAGMADIATSVLHNLGNVLNSVKVSATILSENISNKNFNKLVKLVGMLNEHKDNINQYITNDPKGKLIPEYLIILIDSLIGNSKIAEEEVNCLIKEIEKIENIIAMQKLNTGSVEMKEEVLLSDAIDTAIQLCGSTFEKNNIVLKKEYADHLSVMADKFKLLQILVSVLQNAKDALLSVNSEFAHNKIILIKTQGDDTHSEIIINDNGVGISPDNITKIFSLGFSTKKDGHGFGLHTSALAAKELGGTLQAKSDGIGEGATFTLTLGTGTI